MTTRALHWDRGHPARYGNRKFKASCKLVNFEGCGRDARGPSEEIEWLSVGNY